MAFGGTAVPSGPPNNSRWFDTPDYEEVREAFSLVGRLKAQIEIKEIEIDEVERGVRRGSRKSDDIDAAKEASKDKRRELAELKSKLKIAEYDLDFLNYRKEIFKSVTFSTRN